MSAPPPLFQNPIAGTTINTDPANLGLDSPGPTSGEDNEESTSGSVVEQVKRKASQVKKSGHKKLLSISRRVKSPTSNDDEPKESNIYGKSSPALEPEDRSEQASPTPPSRPSMYSLNFRGEGSLRPGTQTLIQALQAIPWADAEEATQDRDESDDDVDKPAFALSSSIHTIHRPVARNKRRPTAGTTATISSEEENSIGDEEDFDPQVSALGLSNTSAATGSGSPSANYNLAQSYRLGSSEGSPTLRRHLTRSTSLATVKVQRRAKLAEKLREVFDVKEIEEVIGEMPCWLLRSVLLQGYLYLTNSHLCFFAHMPSREDQVLKSGSLSKKAQRTKRWNKHWFVLKNDALTWFHSSADPYFPHGVLDLRYAVSCEPHGDKGFRVRTNQRTVDLDADSVPSRDEWVKAVRKVIFQAQNLGDNVKIAIPYSAILEVGQSTAIDFSETIEIQVIDKEDNCEDSYFFAYFHDIGVAVEQIRNAVKKVKENPGVIIEEVVKDTTSRRLSSQIPGHYTLTGDHDRAYYSPQSTVSTSALSTVRDKLTSPVGKLNSLLRPSSSGVPSVSPVAESSRPSPMGYNSAPIATSPKSLNGTQPLPDATNHTYPPPTLAHQPMSQTSARTSWSVPVGVPTWLKNPSKYFFSASPEATPMPLPGNAGQLGHPPYPAQSDSVLGVSPHHHHHHNSSGDPSDFGFSIVDGFDASALDPVTVDKFRAAFALDEKETLIAEIPGYLFRVLPIFGRVNISTNYFCFRSSQPLTKTRMMIPIRDILSTENAKAFRFGHHGLVVVIKGHEELFFEFNSTERRNACAQLLGSRIDDLQGKNRLELVSPVTYSRDEALLLETLDSPTTRFHEDENPIPPPEGDETVPAVMFTSVGSTFLTFKPQESLRFTCLTIGSRGDVQPYIALAKALKADGHSVKIATHIEYKEWIEGHGIEYGYVGGDPAELMRICVENGMFTVSFLRETLAKFRGWLDDLLKTSWEACQNSDVLIESPSAMGGIHIAEALQIPYYRAFTMPWTRTRAYPHAFAVPESKMGGSYNYLTYVMFDQVFWRAISGQINRWRRNLLHLPSTTLDKLEAHKVPFLYNFSPSIVPPPLDWYEWIRVTGYWFLDDSESSTAKKWEPPAGLVNFIAEARAKNKKLVYIGFGSIVVSDPDAMTKCVLTAVEQSGVYAIMSKGWSDRLSTKKADATATAAAEAVPPLPPQIHNIPSVPHDWLFKQIDAACHHGGAGTTGASLRAGIPTIIKPFFGDQFFWADRVEALGIGSSVRKLTVEHLTAALVTATTDVKQIERAKLVGNAINSEDGVSKAIESIYRDLEYARSIIKVRSEHNPNDLPDSREESFSSSHEDWNFVSGDEDHTEPQSSSRFPFRRIPGLTS